MSRGPPPPLPPPPHRRDSGTLRSILTHQGIRSPQPQRISTRTRFGWATGPPFFVRSDGSTVRSRWDRKPNRGASQPECRGGIGLAYARAGAFGGGGRSQRFAVCPGQVLSVIAPVRRRRGRCASDFSENVTSQGTSARARPRARRMLDKARTPPHQSRFPSVHFPSQSPPFSIPGGAARPRLTRGCDASIERSGVRRRRPRRSRDSAPRSARSTGRKRAPTLRAHLVFPLRTPATWG